MKTHRMLQPCIYLTLILVLAPLWVFAQVSGSSLNGVVTDTTGAIIPDAQVTTQNVETGLIQVVKSNNTGLYSVTPLPPGNYRITVEHPGFDKQIEIVVLTVDQQATINFQMQVGSATQTVTVNAEHVLLNSTTSEISSVIDQNTIDSLPLNGRDPSSLILLSPGTMNMAPTAAWSTQPSDSFTNQGAVSAGGGQEGSTYALLDGSPNMDYWLNQTAPFPNADATEEFRAITANFGAEYGFSPNAVISVQTKSGTNAFHGGLFDFLRNGDLNASNWFSGVVDLLKRNQFGGFVGGPIIINRLFFFANYQGTRASTASGTITDFTPTAAMLQGDFSAVPITLGAPFATVNGMPNQVDPSLLSTAAINIAKAVLPLGQVPATGEVTFSGPVVKTKYDENTDRLDFTISQRQRVFVRSFMQQFTTGAGTIPGNVLATQNESDVNTHGQFYNEVLGYTWLPNSTLANVLTAAWVRMGVNNGSQLYDGTGAPFCFSKFINVTEGECYINNFTVNGGWSGVFAEPNGNNRTTWWLSDALTKTVRNHTISVGFLYNHQRDYVTTGYAAEPQIQFFGNQTGMGLADYVLGDVGSFTQGAFEDSPLEGWQIAAYGQDQWKVRPNLTLTAGLRWEPYPAPKSLFGGSAYVPGEQSTIYPNAPKGLVFPGDKGVTASLIPSGYKYFQPRIGVSWLPFGPRTVLRAGFGLYVQTLPVALWAEAPGVVPFSPIYSLFGAPGSPVPFQNPWSVFGATGGQNPFPSPSSFTQNPKLPASQATFLLPVTDYDSFTRNFSLPVTQSWTLSVEQQLTRTLALHVAYVGNESYHQTVNVDANPGIFTNGGARINPNFSAFFQNTSWGTGSYNALQAQLENQRWHGLQFQSSFTWSKVLDLQSNDDASFSGYGLSNPFDIRRNRGIAAMNIPLVSVTNVVYQIPSFGLKNTLAKEIVGGWAIGGIWTLMSGYPFGIVGGDGNNNSEAQQYGDRGNLVPGQRWNVHQGNKSQWLTHYFNPAAFTVNPPGTFGDTSVNFLKGPGMNTADLSLSKSWSLFSAERSLQFRAEMFNAFNHPNFGLPDNDPSSSNAGQITGIGAISPRVVQLALKLTF